MRKLIINSFISILFIILTSNSIAQTNVTSPPPTNCQAFSISLLSSSPTYVLNNGVYTIKACPYDSITIIATGNYPSNNYNYHQSDSTTIFLWNTLLNNTNNNSQLTVLNNSSGISNIILTAIDTNNCPASDTLIIRVIIAPAPIFNSSSSNDTICFGDSAILYSTVYTGTSYSNSLFEQNDTTYIPDGSGVSYTAYLPITSIPGQTIQNGNDINILATLEHSYLGDIIIKVTCPNGQSSILKSYPGGGSCYLGEPIDNNFQAVSGLGYEYKWSMTGTTTMLNAASNYSHNFTDVLGNSYTNKKYLPPSTSYPANSTASTPYPTVTYLPETNFNSLIGCPINGIWKLTITDNLLVDNGFIFNWKIDLSPFLATHYNQQIASNTWNNSTDIISTIGDSIITVLPQHSGLNQYTYSIIDSMGCSYDTTISLQTLPLPPLDLGNDTVLCGNQSITLNAGSGNLMQYWSTISSLQYITIDSTGIGYDSTLVHVKIYSNNGCTNTDTIIISFINCTGYKGINNNKLKILAYPNPSNGKFTILGNITDKYIDIQILTITGHSILSKSIYSDNNKILETIDLSEFTKGIYFIKLKNSTINNTTKIVIH